MRIQNIISQRKRWISYFIQRKWLCLTAAVVVMTIILLNGYNISGFTRSVAAKESYKYYTSIIVKKGDTLWSIAEEYITEEYDGIEEYISEIRRLNHICGDKIYAGEYLAIPYYAQEIL